MIKNQHAEELFSNFIPYKIGNIVEYNNNGIGYGKVEEITGRFSSTMMDKKFELRYRINGTWISQDSIIRKVGEQ